MKMFEVPQRCLKCDVFNGCLDGVYLAHFFICTSCLLESVSGESLELMKCLESVQSELCDELARLKRIRKIKASERRQRQINALSSRYRKRSPTSWPEIPESFTAVNSLRPRPPEASGVYFVRDSANRIVYIGQSINLQQRVTAQHERIDRHCDSVSWLLFPKQQITWAEYYYIGAEKPNRNFSEWSKADNEATSAEQIKKFETKLLRLKDSYPPSLSERLVSENNMYSVAFFRGRHNTSSH